MPDYGAILAWGAFRFAAPYEQVATVASGIGLSSYLAWEAALAIWARRRPDAQRLALFACAAMIFYITLSGLESLWFRSMIRYTLPWWLLVALCLAHQSAQARWSREGRPGSVGRIARALAGFGIASLIALAVWAERAYLILFLQGGWFA